MQETANTLINEIETITENIVQYIEYENYLKDYKYIQNFFDDPRKSLKKKETYYEKLYESYC